MTAFREDAELAAGADDDGIAVGPRGRMWRTGSRLQNVMEIVQKMQFCNDILHFFGLWWPKCRVADVGYQISEVRCDRPVTGSQGNGMECSRRTLTSDIR